MSTMAYALIVRMIAENFTLRQAESEVNRQYPDEKITYEQIRRVSATRQADIKALRRKLNEELDDLWIANKRQRLIGLQHVYEDANRWVPHSLLSQPGGPPVVVYRKDTSAMLSALKQARDELGESATERAAQSLEDLVTHAEKTRGLEVTAEVGEEVPEAVPVLTDAQLLELPAQQRTAGADEKRGFLPGDFEVDREPVHVLPAPKKDPKKSTPHARKKSTPPRSEKKPQS
jgi:hypothetical protein